MTDEGQKALDAAAYMAAKTAADFFGDRLPENFDATLSTAIAEAAIRAYFAELPGWRLVSVRYLEDAVSDAYTVGQQGRDLDEPYLADPPPPPGLED